MAGFTPVTSMQRMSLPDPIGVDQLKRKNALAEMAMGIDQQNALVNQQNSAVGVQNALTSAGRLGEEISQRQKEMAWRAAEELAAIQDPAQFAAAADAIANNPEFRGIPTAWTREQMTPEAVRQSLPALRAAAGQDMPQVEYGQPVAGVGPDGKQAFRQFSKRGDSKPVEGFQPAPPKSSGGLRIESDGAGGFSLYQGEGANAVPLGKPAQGALQTAAIDSRTALDRLSGIRSGFDPKWLTLKEQATQYAKGIQARAQGLPFVPKLSEADTQSLGAFTTFKSDTLDNLNRTIKELTGAAMGVQEAERIIGALPSLDDDPVSFKAKMDASEQRLRMVLARSIYTQKKGLKFDAIPAERMRILINQRGDELFKTLKDPVQVQQALEAEFFQ